MKKNLIKWITLSLGILLIVGGVFLQIYAGWLTIFDMAIGLWLIIAGLIILIYLYLSAITPREAKVYIDGKGMPDIMTPRYYEEKKLKPGQGFLSRGKIAIPKSSLHYFEIENGIIKIEVRSGKILEGALSDISVKYHLEKNKVSDEFEVSGFTLKNKQTDEKITFYFPGAAFEKEEWNDISAVLSQAGEVNESGLTKMAKIVDKVGGIAENVDFSNLVDSAVAIASDHAMSAAADKLMNIALDQKSLEKSKGANWKKITKKVILWIILVACLLYVICDVIVQIENHKLQNATENTSEFYDDIEDDSVGLAAFQELAEYMDSYEITFNDGKNAIIALQPETGRGVYCGPSGKNYLLTIDAENPTRTYFECSTYNLDESQADYVIIIYIHHSGNRIEGYLNNKSSNQTLSFDGALIQADITASSLMGFNNGYNHLDGNMIHTDGRKFPMSLDFYYDADSGNLSNIRYKNIGSGTELSLDAEFTDEDQVRMTGMDGGKEFIILFSGNNPYYGHAWWGKFHQDIELFLAN